MEAFTHVRGKGHLQYLNIAKKIVRMLSSSMLPRMTETWCCNNLQKQKRSGFLDLFRNVLDSDAQAANLNHVATVKTVTRFIPNPQRNRNKVR